MQCRPAGKTPSAPLFHRNAPAPLAHGLNSGDDGQVEPEEDLCDDVDNIIQDDLAVYTDIASDPSQFTGLGLIQPHGRAQVLEYASRRQCMSTPDTRPNGARPLEAFRNLLRPPQPVANNIEQLEMEWSTLADAAKSALKQWCAGHLGARHCMLIVEHNAGTDSAIGSFEAEQSFASNLRGGAALNVLSGLQAEVELMS